MKALVIYYSRTGITKKVAEEIARSLGAGLEEIADTKDRSGPVGYLVAGKDATLGARTSIRKPEKDPSKYDMVIIGTPVWSFTVSVPVKEYILMNKERIGKAAFFCTQGDMGAEGAFREMKRLCGKKPVATLALRTVEVAKGEYGQKMKEFVGKLR
ncbi:MAG: flavodoxin [Candidatus Micrarchaeota archaeon]